MQCVRDGFVVDDDRDRLRQCFDRIAGWLGGSYWAGNRRPDEILRSWEHAGVVLGAYADDEACVLVSCCRAVTDFARFAYLSDVYVLPELRGRGLGSWMVGTMLDLPDLAGVRWVLDTNDAHAVYRRLGFVETAGTTMHRPARISTSAGGSA